MKLKDAMLWALEHVRAFEAALDYDPMGEVAVRVRELEMEVQLRRNDLAVLTADVRTLRSGLESRDGTQPRRPSRQITE